LTWILHAAAPFCRCAVPCALLCAVLCCALFLPCAVLLSGFGRSVRVASRPPGSARTACRPTLTIRIAGVIGLLRGHDRRCPLDAHHGDDTAHRQRDSGLFHACCPHLTVQFHPTGTVGDLGHHGRTPTHLGIHAG